MATNEKAQPAFTIPPEMRKKLEDQSATFESIKQEMGALKEMGVEVKTLEDQLEWAEKARQILLTRFK